MEEYNELGKDRQQKADPPTTMKTQRKVTVALKSCLGLLRLGF